jgi:predicted HTH transcriptional regulator
MEAQELDDILATLRENDGDAVHVEAKSATEALPRRLWETISAFANSPGGASSF